MNSLAESLLRAGARLQDSETEAQAAETIARAIAMTGWRTVIVSLYDDRLRTVALGTAGVSDELHRQILSNRGDDDARRALFAPQRDRFLVGRFYFIPEEDAADLGVQDLIIPTATQGEADAPSAWRPRDHAYAALRDSRGRVIGRIAIDQPWSGQRPTPDDLREVSAFIDLASRSIENLRLRRSLDTAVAAARHSDERWRLLIENVHVIAWEADARTLDFTYVSPYAEQALGYPVSEWYAPGFWADHIDPEDRRRVVAHCRECCRDGRDHRDEYRMIAADSSTRWFRDTVSVRRDADGRVTGLCGVLIDITAERMAEQSLRERENRLRVLNEQLPAVLWTLDRDLRFTLSQGRGLEALGVGPGQVVGMPLSEYLGTDDPDDTAYAAHARALRGERASFEFVSPGGATFECHVEPLRGKDDTIVGCIGVALDISRRKQAELDTLRAQEELRKITDAIPVQISYLDARCRYQFNNETYERWHLRPRSEITGRHAADLIGQEAFRAIEPYVRRVLRGEVVQFESPMNGRLGGISHVRTSLTPDFGEDGQVRGFYSVTMDITDRVHAERALSNALAHRSNLLKELSHRVKNSMTGLLGLIELSRTRERSVDSFANAVRGRVEAMIRVHSLLSANEWNPVPLRDLLASIVPSHTPGRLEFDGPGVIVAPAYVGPLGAILQELLSNSLRHGALGVAGGVVHATWSPAPPEPGHTRLQLRWREQGGPTIPPDPTPGLGTDLIRGFAQHDLHGRIEFDFRPAGVDHRLEVRIGDTPS